jgi:hypothetical protein
MISEKLVHVLYYIPETSYQYCVSLGLHFKNSPCTAISAHSPTKCTILPAVTCRVHQGLVHMYTLHARTSIDGLGAMATAA